METFAQSIYNALVELSNPEIRTVSRGDPIFNLTQPEVLLPTTIVLPGLSNRRAPLMEFFRQYGLRLRNSLTILQMDQDARRILVSLGYYPEPEHRNVYHRMRPLRVISQQVPIEPLRGLPEIIPMLALQSSNATNFALAHGLNGMTTQELQTYLISQGYIYDPTLKALVKMGQSQGGPMISQESSLRSIFDFITPEMVVSEIRQPTKVVVSQHDLEALAISRPTLIREIGEIGALDQGLWKIQEKYHVNPDTGRFMLVASAINHFNSGQLMSIVQSLGIQINTGTGVMLNDIRALLQAKIVLSPRTYDRRLIYPSGPVPSNLQQALEEGYDIRGNETLMNELAALVRLDVRNRYVRFWAELLRDYPDMARGFFRLLPNSGNNISYRTVTIIYMKEPNTVEEFYTYLVGAPLQIQESPADIERRRRLEALPATYATVLRQLYETRNIDEIMTLTPSPLEAYLVSMPGTRNKQGLIQLANSMGMVIPPDVNPRDYIKSNMIRYVNVVSRPSVMPPILDVLRQPGTLREFNNAVKQYSDIELIQAVGYTAPFRNRVELIERIHDMLTETAFFILQAIDLTRVINTETTLFENFNELLPPFIAFGMVFRYRIYSLDELNTAFGNEGDNIRFSVPESPQRQFDSSDLRSLATALNTLSQMRPQLSDTVQEVRNKITTGLLERMTRDRNTDNVHSYLRTAPQNVRDAVQEIFMNIFYAGMYMRRWKGPGHPYPVTEASTIGTSDPQPKSILVLGKVSELMNNLVLLPGGLDARDLMETLKIATPEQGSFLYLGIKLFELIGTVAQGNTCIRQASRSLTTTSYFYLQLFFGYTIPDIDPNEIASIS